MSLLPRPARADQNGRRGRSSSSFRSRPAAPPIILARVGRGKISEEFGQQFIVENKTGAGGNIAADYVAKAEPDGYTFVVGTPGTHAINQFVFKNMTYDQAKDIAPVIIIARVPNLLFGHQFAAGEIGRRIDRLCQVEARRVVLRHARARQHRACLDRTVQVDDRRRDDPRALQGQRTGADRPDRRPRATDDRQSAGGAAVRRNPVQSVRCGLSAKRWPGLPDLPTIAEAGVPGYEASSWFTIGAPAKTSKEIIGRLNASVDKFLKTEDGIARLRKLGAEPAGGSPEDMQAYVLAETEKWGKVAKFAGIKPE